MADVASKVIGGLALLTGGYALAYYGMDVLVWAHTAGNPPQDPVPLSHLIGLPTDTPAAASGTFMPPFKLGTAVPGSITDARGLLGGTPTTGAYTPAVGGATGGPGSSTDLGATGIGPSVGNTGGGGGTGLPAVPSSSSTRGPSGGGATSMPLPGNGSPGTAGNPATGVYVQNGMQQLANGKWVPLPGPSSSTANSSGANR